MRHKTPVLHIDDSDRLVIFEDLKGILEDYNPAWIEQESGVSNQTIYNWLAGKTKKPRLDTITKVARAVGYELVLQKTRQVKGQPRLRLVK